MAGTAPRSADELRRDILAASGVFLFAFALYLLPAVLARPLCETPEARLAAVAREMVRSGDYVVPRLAGEPRLNKPPLPYWLAAGAAHLLGGGADPSRTVMTRAVLLPPALLGALALFVVVLYGCKVFGRPAGVMAGLLLGFSLLPCRFAQLGYGDITLLFLCAGMLCSAAWLVSVPRPGILSALALGITLGLAVLTKGHIPLLLLAAPVLFEVLLRRRFNGRKVLVFVAALVIAAAIAAPWFLAVMKREPTAWAAMSRELGEAVSPTGHVQSDRWYYYFYRLAGSLAPWTLLLLAAWPLGLKRCRELASESAGSVLLAREQARFFLVAFVLGLLGFYLAPKQQEHYLLPLLPALALVSGFMLSHFRFPGGVPEERLAWVQLGVGVVGGLAIATLPWWPPDLIGETEQSRRSLKLLYEPAGWALAGLLGLACFLLHFYCARQWVEGKPLRAAIAMAVAAYVGLGVWSWRWAEQTQQTTVLNAEAPGLSARLRELGPDVKVYGVGIQEALLAHYLDIDWPVKTEQDLGAEPPGEGANAPRRALLVERKRLPLLEKDYQLELSDDLRRGPERIVIVLLPQEPPRDWPKEAAAALRARKEKRRQ